MKLFAVRYEFFDAEHPEYPSPVDIAAITMRAVRSMRLRYTVGGEDAIIRCCP